ncbi:MAG: tyrosine-type recombinase/integrase [bacterium]|nr:tyrosine-type recombinase/integrase [bacterium]
MNKSSIPIIRQVQPFLEYCEVEKGLSPVSTKNYHNFLKVFVVWLKANKLDGLKPHELTPEHIWDYRLYLSRKKDPANEGYIKKTSQSYYLIALRNLLNFFAVRDIISLPAEKIKLPKITDKEKQIKFLSVNQIEKLMAMPDVSTADGLRDRSILEVLFSTGLRVSELASLNIRQFDLKNILAGKITDMELSVAGKGGSTRTVYFAPHCIKWLAQYLKTRADMLPSLFINYKRGDDGNDHRLSTRSIERMVKKYAMMAGLPVDATPHTLRHSFATDLLEQGADMRSVQELLGHKNIMTTQIYTHVTNPHLRDIHKKFHSGNK